MWLLGTIVLLLSWLPNTARELSLLCYLIHRWGKRDRFIPFLQVFVHKWIKWIQLEFEHGSPFSHSSHYPWHHLHIHLYQMIWQEWNAFSHVFVASLQDKLLFTDFLKSLWHFISTWHHIRWSYENEKSSHRYQMIRHTLRESEGKSTFLYLFYFIFDVKADLNIMRMAFNGLILFRKMSSLSFFSIKCYFKPIEKKSFHLILICSFFMESEFVQWERSQGRKLIIYTQSIIHN